VSRCLTPVSRVGSCRHSRRVGEEGACTVGSQSNECMRTPAGPTRQHCRPRPRLFKNVSRARGRRARPAQHCAAPPSQIVPSPFLLPFPKHKMPLRSTLLLIHHISLDTPNLMIQISNSCNQILNHLQLHACGLPLYFCARNYFAEVMQW
jgi:hypothetical protein